MRRFKGCVISKSATQSLCEGIRGRTSPSTSRGVQASQIHNEVYDLHIGSDCMLQCVRFDRRGAVGTCQPSCDVFPTLLGMLVFTVV